MFIPCTRIDHTRFVAVSLHHHHHHHHQGVLKKMSQYDFVKAVGKTTRKLGHATGIRTG
jgi:hypothetical protein